MAEVAQHAEAEQDQQDQGKDHPTPASPTR
jgi:hypothetical protein